MSALFPVSRFSSDLGAFFFGECLNTVLEGSLRGAADLSVRRAPVWVELRHQAVPVDVGGMNNFDQALNWWDPVQAALQPWEDRLCGIFV